MSLSTGARSSPWKVGTDATISSADLASARLRLLGAKVAKSCSSMFITNCKRANDSTQSYPADDPHRPGTPSVCTAWSAHALARTAIAPALSSCSRSHLTRRRTAPPGVPPCDVHLVCTHSSATHGMQRTLPSPDAHSVHLAIAAHHWHAPWIRNARRSLVRGTYTWRGARTKHTTRAC